MTPSTATTGLLLAAGEGRRYGMPKALVDTGDGPWVGRSARVLLEGGCRDVLVVLGAEADAVEQALGTVDGASVDTVRCGTWTEGMGESLRAGLTALATRGRTVPTRVLVHLVDLPDVGSDVVARLLRDAPAGPDVLARASYETRPGHPVLLGRSHWQAVLDGARGDAGARAYLRRATPSLVECGDLATGTDVDTPAAP